jgi:hypothetical protein
MESRFCLGLSYVPGNFEGFSQRLPQDKQPRINCLGLRLAEERSRLGLRLSMYCLLGKGFGL